MRMRSHTSVLVMLARYAVKTLVRAVSSLWVMVMSLGRDDNGSLLEGLTQ